MARVIVDRFLLDHEGEVSSKHVLNSMLQESSLIPDQSLATHVYQVVVLLARRLQRDKLKERNLSLAVEGHIVHWIERRALFGHDHSHCTYLNKQFWSYEGLVQDWSDRGILLKDCLPSDIVTVCHGNSPVTTD